MQALPPALPLPPTWFPSAFSVYVVVPLMSTYGAHGSRTQQLSRHSANSCALPPGAGAGRRRSERSWMAGSHKKGTSRARLRLYKSRPAVHGGEAGAQQASGVPGQALALAVDCHQRQPEVHVCRAAVLAGGSQGSVIPEAAQSVVHL